MPEIVPRCACCSKEGVALLPKLAADGESLMEVCLECDKDLRATQQLEKEEKAKKTVKWEYSISCHPTIRPSELMDCLNTLGDQGWELLLMTEQVVKDFGLTNLFIFKRRL